MLTRKDGRVRRVRQASQTIRAEAGSGREPYFRAYGNDGLARLLLDKFRTTPIRFSAIVLTFQLVTNTIIAWLFGLHSLPPGAQGILQDWRGAGIQDLIMTPVLAYYYLWTALAPARTIRDIREAKLLQIGEDEFDRIVKGPGNTVANWFNSRWLVRLVLIVLVALAVQSFAWHWAIAGGQSTVPRIWLQYSKGYLFFFKWPIWVACWYMLMMIIARELVAIRAFFHLFWGRRIELYPLHPDGCGGLGPLNRYVMKFSYLIATFGIGVTAVAWSSRSLGSLTHDAPVLVALAGYVLLAPTLFFGPLASAHRAMQEAKDRFLQQLSAQFVKDIKGAYDELDESSSSLKDNVEKIEYLQKIYNTTKGFPVWPWDGATVRSFFATVWTPILPILVSVGSEAIKRALLPSVK